MLQNKNNNPEITSKMRLNKIPYGVKFINPEVVIKQIGIASGMSVAIFGCGTGYFAISTAKKILQTGAVYALDILKQKLEAVESQAKLLGLNNIELKRVNLEGKDGSGLPDSEVDWVIMANMLFQNENKSRIILEAKRVLREGGKILVIEWKENDCSIGPKPEVRVSKEALIKIARKNGLGVLKEIAVSDFHYGLILTK